LVELKSREFLLVALLLQFIVFITVFLDVPVARQVVGFIYFSFFPGFVIVNLLKLDDLDAIETILFSVALSIAFLMLGGLSINELLPLFGILRPLSLMPLMIIFNALIFLGVTLVYFRGETFEFKSSAHLRLSPFSIFFLSLPMLSVVGSIWVNTYRNNIILLLMIIAIALLFVIGVVFKKLLPPRLHWFAVLSIAVALLYHSSLISNYILHFGSDVVGEYFVFNIVEKSAHWTSNNPYLGDELLGRSNAMLSITLLPTIYSNLLNIDSIWIFKALFPLIFSLVPLGLYWMWKTSFGKNYAFISTFLFMAQSTFYTEMLGLNRQMIAELFYVLLLLVVLNKKINPLNKTVCFMIFSFALITSHYGLSEIFLFYIFFTFMILIVFKQSRSFTPSMIMFFFIMMFSWYIYTSNSSTFNSFIEFGDYIFSQLGDFFDPASRGLTVLRGLGLEASPSFLNMISRVFAYITQAFIVIGFVGLIKKRTKFDLQREYHIFTVLSMAFLLALILVPGLANTLNMTRFYHILLFFLAPLCAVGAETIISFISKQRLEMKTSVLILMVLVPYFLFQTNLMYETTNVESWSISLSKYRMSPLFTNGHFGYTDAYSVFGAQWLSKKVTFERIQIYSDSFARRNELRIYGGIYINDIETLSNITKVRPNGIVYLSSLNVIEGIIGGVRSLWNSSELNYLRDLNMIYSNGGGEIYKKIS